ncbi:5'/3'-nucleotidase SurE [bacterium]|nr:MAG: 5'/3'-nucleotidase SurE [bacterium]
MILITNDDGIQAKGLSILRKAVQDLDEVWVFAPDRERSAMSHSFTMHRPIYIERVEERVYVTDGTPTDCVLYPVRGILPEKPKLVLSGINHGANLGEDVTYSGTVAAAFEGMILGIPSVAFSMVGREIRNEETARIYARKIAAKVLREGLPHGILLNVNIPDIPPEEVKGIKITRLGKRVYRDTVIEKIGKDGKRYYILGGEPPSWIPEDGTDFSAIEEGYISITPLHLNLTDFPTIEKLKRWEQEIEGL